MRTAPRMLAAAAALAACLAARGDEVDLSTPRRALRTFIDSGRAGDWASAARVFDPGAVSAVAAPDDAQRLARELKFVLDARMWIDWERVPDVPAVDATAPQSAELVGTVVVDGAPVPIRLVRQTDGTWRFGRATTAAIPRLYARYGPGWIGDHVPRSFVDATFLEIQAWQWTGLVLAVALALVVALLVGAVLQAVALRIARRTRATWDDRLVHALAAPGRLALGAALFTALERALRLAAPAHHAVGHLERVAAVVTLAWALLRAIALTADLVGDRLTRDDADAAVIRARATQVMILRRLGGFAVVVIAAALVLMQFDALRAVGASILASAGVAGIVIGFAAQRTIAALVAGVQLSLTQPIKVGDVVVVDGAWGTVEEITLTHVVVKVWDLRRLVVPITRFFDGPFENWTRTGSRILGTVLLRADFRVPVAKVRRELERFVRTRPEWDGDVAVLQVTDVTEAGVELRALISSEDAARSWDLRCATREHLVMFLQELESGRYLPRTRVEALGARNTAVMPHLGDSAASRG